MPEAFKSNSHGNVRGACTMIIAIPEGLNSSDLLLFNPLRG